MRARPWLKLHRLLGLAAGLPFVLAGLTGSVLVFDHAIDEWLNPDLLLAGQEGEPASLQAVLDAAAGPEREPLLLRMPRRPGAAYVVEVLAPAPQGGEARRLEVGVDPVGPTRLGERPVEGHLMQVVYALHSSVLLGRGGEVALGVVGLLALVGLASGLGLGRPVRGKIGPALRVRRDRAPIRQLFDLHRATGLYASLVLLVVVVTGVYLVFADSIRPVVGLVSPLTPVPTELRSSPRPEARTIPADRAVAAALEVFPDGEVKLLHLPRGPEGVYRVAVRRPGEVRRSGAQSGVAVDRYDGEVLAVVDSGDGSAGDAVLAWPFPLHNGEAFGLVGRWLVFFSGAAPLLLFATGVLLWRRRRRARLAARAMRFPSPPPTPPSRGSAPGPSPPRARRGPGAEPSGPPRAGLVGRGGARATGRRSG